MFVLIWATLLFSVRGSNAGASVRERQYCPYGFCITLTEGEITAEAGLCVVIPCSFTTPDSFTTQHIVWYKCEPSKDRCEDSDIIFDTNKNNINLQTGFKGRVSLLESDLSQKNCSIVINDLTASDSGSYQLRVNARTGGFTFLSRATVSVKDLSQRPTVMIPPLTEGQQTTLTCTAPVLCSGSVPTITWTWRGTGENNIQITGNIMTENLTAVTQRHSSTLTFNSSAEHHGTNVTCKVSFTGDTTTEETVTLNVTYVKVTGNTSVNEGETLNLTCSVESFLPSLIMWTKLSDKNVKNGTESNLQNYTETATLIIPNVTTEHAGKYICTAKHLNKTLTKEVDVTVIYIKKPGITGDVIVKEGDTLKLTCSVESFPPSLIMWTKLSNKNVKNGTETNLPNDTLTDPKISTESDLQIDTQIATLIIPNVTAEHAGQYICTAKHLNNTLMEEVNITVIYMKKPRITGDAIVKEGDTLNLTCSVESFPPSLITWTKLDLNTNLQNGIDANLQNDTGLSTLIITNVTAEHSGRYICTAKHVDSTLTVYVDVTVTWFAKILNGSGCVAQSTVLTCGCISQGVPLPTIKWPLMKNHNEYSVITTVSNHTVNSTITLTVKDHSNTAVECVSSNENGEAKEKLTVIQMNTPEKESQSRSLLKNVSWLEIIIAFLTGAFLSATLCCLAKKCHREKQKSSGNLDGTLEMVTTQEDPLIHAGQAVEDDQTHHQEAPKDGAEAVEKGAPDLDGGPKDAEYASIDFSVLKRRSARGAAKKQETTETEYAEIKREEKVERQDSGGEPDEVLECKEEEAVIVEDEEIKHCVPEEEEAEDAALYSNVKDIIGEI
ncbi:sialic acid-binding Ig-like lectin 10 [Thunnus albacares]|uniref:sialic acid-binding Ig-like lectin 10 n=1 Tax=Thunnus albacares TaxID=8236 RepID=UPI001CF69DCC|nr:sialic acid-binding Ig-like lectin 10 [Thunnus albacares]